MNKVANYLQEHLEGEVLTDSAIRNYFATDASVLTITPNMVVYPRNTNDVRKVMRFSWQLAERGHVLPVTARGKGTDLGGAALGNGIILALPAHMNRLLEIDTKQQRVRIQPGINYRTLQETLYTHNRFLPPYPASMDYSTVGGAIANNSSGEKSLKYGNTRKYVDKLEVVLANGELIQTGRLSKRELNHKKGETTFEAEVYRQLDGIITDNWDVIQKAANQRISKNSSGYNLADVKHTDGSFDITPLLVGSQGTLGIVTEAILKLEPYNPKTSLLLAEFDDLTSAHDAISLLLKLEPSALEMVDQNLLAFVTKQQPDRLKGLIESETIPAVVLLIEFDDPSERTRKHQAKKAKKLLQNLASNTKISDDYEQQQKMWNIRHMAATVVNYNEAGKASLPIIEDGVVPHEQFQAYIEGVYELCTKYRLQPAIWGHAGDANLHIQPLMDLGKLSDRQHVFKIMEEYYDLVLKLGGSISAEHNDGRLRTPFIVKQFGTELADIFVEVKKAFDPSGMLNPGVKTDMTLKELAPLLRREYSIAHLSDHLPRT
ncbi:MAG TPA: FAD-linked oxidase C-terminal domain-containing protein [Candidatus Saccharimonadales bacterium]|jgi:FAD/FMN-containing dehydrogenase|nr:FAD-linked oxidase C-terminal domain-containing protein [Candidatus Saccharimonadales bacterium]